MPRCLRQMDNSQVLGPAAQPVDLQRVNARPVDFQKSSGGRKRMFVTDARHIPKGMIEDDQNAPIGIEFLKELPQRGRARLPSVRRHPAHEGWRMRSGHIVDANMEVRMFEWNSPLDGNGRVAYEIFGP